MEEVAEVNDLKQILDNIDQEAVNQVQGLVYKSHYLNLVFQWIKGRAIAKYRDNGSRGDVPILSFYEIERLTGRGHTHCKRWYNLYSDQPNEEKFKAWAESVADIRALKFQEKIEALSDKEKDKLPEPVDRGKDTLKCLAKKYSGLDPVWIKNCEGCLRLGICQEIVGLIEQDIIREDQELSRN